MRCHDYEEAEKHSFFQMNGGRRPGAGRKPGKRSPQHQLAADTFSRVLAAADAESIWKKLLTCNQMKVVADCLQYLTDRVYGRPQQMIGGNGTPVKIELQWTGTPEWLQPQIQVNQQVIASEEIIKNLIEGS
jgi:hypothetical protein